MDLTVQKYTLDKDKKMQTMNTISESRIIVENTFDKNNVILGRINAILVILNEKSQNGTYYDDKWYDKAVVRNERFQERLKKKLILGELDHPKEAVAAGIRTAFTLLELERKGNEVWGKLEIFNTPAGQIMWTLIQAGVVLGFSLRGLGTDYYDHGVMKIDGDTFEMKGWDAVVDPSFVKAEFKSFTEEKKNTFINDIKKVDNKYKIARLLLEELNKMNTEEIKDKNLVFENEQQKLLIAKLESTILESKKNTEKIIKEITEQKQALEHKVKSLESANVNLQELVKGKDLLLESKNKTINDLRDAENRLNETIKLVNEDVNEKKLLIEKYKNQVTEQKNEPKIEITINKKDSVDNKSNVSSLLKSRSYKVK